jgi:hypothetical protein
MAPCLAPRCLSYTLLSVEQNEAPGPWRTEREGPGVPFGFGPAAAGEFYAVPIKGSAPARIGGSADVRESVAQPVSGRTSVGTAIGCSALIDVMAVPTAKYSIT